MEYNSILKKKEILPFSWTDLEDTMPGELSQPQKEKYCMSACVPLYEATKIVKGREGSSGKVVTRWCRRV